jgi:hypothetical protein
MPHMRSARVKIFQQFLACSLLRACDRFRGWSPFWRAPLRFVLRYAAAVVACFALP